MNPKIRKLKTERKKNEEKIVLLQNRNGEIDRQIRELENLDIVDMVRNQGMTPEQLQTLLESREEGGGHA